MFTMLCVIRPRFCARASHEALYYPRALRVGRTQGGKELFQAPTAPFPSTIAFGDVHASSQSELGRQLPPATARPLYLLAMVLLLPQLLASLELFLSSNTFVPQSVCIMTPICSLRFVQIGVYNMHSLARSEWVPLNKHSMVYTLCKQNEPS